MKNIIKTSKAPHAIGTYSQGIKFQDFVFTSGQICLDSKTNKLVNHTFNEEVHQVIYNLESILKKAGSSLDKILKITVYITDLSLFPQLNDIFMEYFPKHPPARSTVEVSALPMKAKVEIEAIGII